MPVRYPERVSELVLTGVATGRRSETDLLTRERGDRTFATSGPSSGWRSRAL
jgi:hypothetical protein